MDPLQCGAAIVSRLGFFCYPKSLVRVFSLLSSHRVLRPYGGWIVDEVIFELFQHGIYLKVTAIDPQSGEEAIAFGPVADTESVKALALNKLRFKLEPKLSRQLGLRA